MKKVIILVLMSLMVAAMLHASIISKAEQYVNEMNALLVAIGVLIGTALGVWYKVREFKKTTEIKEYLASKAVPLISQAATSPVSLLGALRNPPEVNLLQNPNESKNKIVAAALIENEPNKTKKIGLTDIISAGNFITGIYKQIKPLIKKR